MRWKAVRAGARLLGALSGAGAAGAWLWLWVGRPWGELGIATPAAALVTAIFAGMALAGLGAALKDVPVVLALVGLFSLLPVGTYFLVAPGYLPVIGWCDVGMLVSGAVLLVAHLRGGDGAEALEGAASADHFVDVR